MNRIRGDFLKRRLCDTEIYYFSFKLGPTTNGWRGKLNTPSFEASFFRRFRKFRASGLDGAHVGLVAKVTIRERSFC